MSELTDVVDAQVKAFNERDIDRFLECYAPTAVVKDGDGNIMMSGAESLRGMYGQLFSNSPDLAVDIPNRIVVGQYVIDEERITGFTLPGYPQQVQSVAIYRVEDGTIKEVTLLM